MKYRLILLFGLLFFVSSLAACDQAPAKNSAPDNGILAKEGFSYEGSAVLRVHGSKDEDMALRITTLFMSLSPDCLGMYVLDEPDPAENSLSKPGKGPAGKYYQTGIAFRREKEYALEVPLQLKHPQCEWQLVSSTFHLGNDFSWGRERTTSGGNTILEMHYSPLEGLAEHDFLKRVGIYMEEFMPVAKIHLYNQIAEDGYHMLRSYLEGRKGLISRTMMPLESTAKSAEMRLDLHIEAVIDARKGEELPKVPEFGFEQE